MSTLDTVVAAHAAHHGARIALVSCRRDGEEALTWRELDQASATRAAQLRALIANLPAACLVVPLAEHDRAELVGLVAALRVAAPVLVVNGRQSPQLLQALLEEVRCRGHTLVPADATDIDAAGAGPHGYGPTVGPCDLLLASGGTTGRPKLIVDRGVRATPARPAALRPFLATGWRPGQRQLLCSPLYHAAGFTPFVEGLAGGNATHVSAAFDPHRLGDLIDGYRIDWLQMTPFHMGAVLAGDRGPARWRVTPRLVHMADSCPPRVKRAFHAALDATRVYEMYAASEGIGMTMARGDEWDRRPGTVGRGFRTALRVADEEGRPLDAFETGEVYMRSGARRAATYLSHAGRLRIAPDGFATLGDVGHLDEDGYLFLTPRQIATISVAGVTVSPTEVEAELRGHPQIADVGVCGQASAELGERVVAVVVPASDDLTPGAVRRWARARLSSAQLPSRYVFTTALPRAGTGKLDRTALAALVAGNGGEWPQRPPRKEGHECGSS